MEENKKVIGSVVLESGNIKHIYAVQNNHINTKILSVAKKYEKPYRFKVVYQVGETIEEIEGTYVLATKDFRTLVFKDYNESFKTIGIPISRVICCERVYSVRD